MKNFMTVLKENGDGYWTSKRMEGFFGGFLSSIKNRGAPELIPLQTQSAGLAWEIEKKNWGEI